MISKELSRRIYNTHRQLEHCDELERQLREESQRLGGSTERFRGLDLQLSFTSYFEASPSIYNLFDISPQLSLLMVAEHRKQLQSDLASLEKEVQQGLDSSAVASASVAVDGFVEINGLLWARENSSIDGETHFSFLAAQKLVSSEGLRLPTGFEFESLLSLNSFVVPAHGVWFGEDCELLDASVRSVFFPFSGWEHGAQVWGSDGYYWSSSLAPDRRRQYLNVSPSGSSQLCKGSGDFKFCVRGVKDIK